MSSLNTYLPQHFREFLIELDRHQAEYIVIGGYALGAYGRARGTNDLDVFINATEENALKMKQACVSYGIPDESLTLEMFMVPRMVAIGEFPLRIEIIKKLDVVDFKYAYQRVKTMQVDDLSVPVVSLNDLILLKHAAVKGRKKARDSEDLSFLQKLKAALSQRGKS
jgi:predicted nucleotidyltransferase